MAESDQKTDDLSTSGTETFNVPGQDPGKRIILNIEDDKTPGIVLEKDTKDGKLKTGNPIVDLYDKLNSFFVEHSKVKVKAKATFYHLLSVMLAAGVPMVSALRSLVAQAADNPRLSAIITGIATSIEEGASLSDAMMLYSSVFTEQEIGMIRSGEESGKITSVLANLARNTEKTYEIKSKIKSAMMYPIVVFLLLIVVIIAMMVFVVPKLTELFASTGTELPLITRVVVGISNFMVNHGILMLIIIVVLVSALTVFKKTDVGHYYFDLFKLKVPIFGKLFKQSYLARFARSISDLLDSGVSIIRAFEITANSMGNEVFRRRLLLAMEDVKQGIPLADNLSASDLFPPMLVSMIEVGEKTAQLDVITDKLSKFYEGEVDTAVNGLSKILEPIILIVIGVTVGAVVAAIMLPIMNLSDLAGSL